MSTSTQRIFSKERENFVTVLELSDLSSPTQFNQPQINALSQKITSESFKIGIRVSQWKQQDYEAKITSDAEELNKFFNILKDAGADFIHCSNRRFWEGEFKTKGLNLAGVAKEATGLPTISVGSVGLDKDFIKLYFIIDPKPLQHRVLFSADPDPDPACNN